MPDKDVFMKSVREALGKADESAQPEYLALRIGRPAQAQKVRTIVAKNEARRQMLATRLKEMAPKSGYTFVQAESAEAACDYVVGLATARRAKLVVRSQQEVFQHIPLDEKLSSAGVMCKALSRSAGLAYGALRSMAARAGIGVTGVDYAIAETGTCVLTARQGLSRLVALLPPVHVALVEPRNLVESIDDFLAQARLSFLEGHGGLGSYTNLITGPSRTGDIEQTIVIGAHGPKEVHLVLLPEMA